MKLKQRITALVHTELWIYLWYKLIDEDEFAPTSNVLKPSKNKISNSFEDPSEVQCQSTSFLFVVLPTVALKRPDMNQGRLAR